MTLNQQVKETPKWNTLLISFYSPSIDAVKKIMCKDRYSLIIQNIQSFSTCPVTLMEFFHSV